MPNCNKSNPLGLESRFSPYVWLTWLAPYLSGENQCQFALWTLANFKVPANGEMPSDWLVKHQSLINELAIVLREDGYKVEVDDANALYLKTRQGVTLAGKPDLVARNGQGLVIEGKTGTPKAKDRAQVMLYMALIPSQKLHGITEIPWGKLVYRSGEVKMIPPSEIDESFKQSLQSLIVMLANPMPPAPIPSFHECRYCKNRGVCPHVQDLPPEANAMIDWL